jgi:HK97 family phage portal protein
MFLSRLFGRGPRAHAPVSESKASRTAAVFAWQGMGRPVWTPRDYAALAREGYQRNPVVHRAVRMVAEAAAGVTLVAFDGEREVPDHPVLGLLARPNARDGGAAMLQALYGHLLVSGNAYLERVDIDGVPRELHVLRPDRVRVVPGPDGWAQAWDYTVSGRSVRLETPPDGPAPVLQLALFNPLDDHYGLSPMEAAAAALDVHNAAGAWNKALLDNAARPSGALVYAGPAGATLGEEQFQRLKAELEAGFQGSANAGRPLLLEGGLDWKPLSLSPQEMDFVAAKAAAAREIALAFGVPPMLLGLPGDNTYANFAEANRSFWRQTVLPLAARTAQSLAHWLGPTWPGDLRLEPDLDRIDALSAERGELWARVGASDFLTRDEKRAAVGYGAEGIEQDHKGGWGGSDQVEGDVTATPRGGEDEGQGSTTRGDASGVSEHWRNQPRVPAGNADGGQWTGEGSAASSGSNDDDLATGTGGRTTNFRLIARRLGLEYKEIGDMIHDIKEFYGLAGNDNLEFDFDGEVYFKGESLGNIMDYRK